MGEWIKRWRKRTHLKNNWGNQTLDLGRTETLFLSFLLGQWPLDDVLPNVILLGKVEEFADLRSTLGTQSLRHSNIGQAGDFLRNNTFS